MKIRANSIFISAAAVLLGIASCSKDNETGVPDYTVRFSAGIAPGTMAPIESDATGLVTSGTLTGIQILRGAEGTTPKFNYLPQGASSGVPTTTATLDGTGVMITADEMRYNEDGTAANFMAYYPKNTTVGGVYVKGDDESKPARVDWTIDGETDIIAAKRVSKTYTASGNNIVQLNFEHLLARVRFKCVCVDDANRALYQGVSEANIVVPNQVYTYINADGTFTPMDFKSTAAADRITLDFGPTEMSTEGEFAKKDLLICAKSNGAFTDGSIYLKFAGFPDDAAKPYILTNLKLVPGKTTVITATVKGATSLVITSEIEEWKSADTGVQFPVE